MGRCSVASVMAGVIRHAVRAKLAGEPISAGNDWLSTETWRWAYNQVGFDQEELWKGES